MDIPVISYHSISPRKNADWPKGNLTLELRYFEDQIRYLGENGFVSLFLDEFFRLKNSSDPITKNYVCITFDDGYVDNWIYAFPLLKKYNLKATIFVNPEFVDKKNGTRRNLDDHWDGAARFEELNKWGFLSWEEMYAMESSGLIDIQSHTVTHTKYFVSDKIIKFHHPGNDCIYVVGNHYPERKPYYIGDKTFENLLPYGFPVFEEASSLIAKRIDVNPDFSDEVVDRLRRNDWGKRYDFQSMYKRIESAYNRYRDHGNLIVRTESEPEYLGRIMYELEESKSIIEKRLNKKVSYLCCPHGDYNDNVLGLAHKAGYEGTCVDVNPGETCPPNGIERIGLRPVKNSRFLTQLRAKYKIRSYQGKVPHSQIRSIYYRFKYKV